jgi:hypothetical protein
MKQHEIETMLEAGVPSIPTRTDEKKAIEYVGLVYQGMDKVEAYKMIFPDRTERIAKKANADRRGYRPTMMYNIGVYERGKYVTSLYNVGSKNYFTQFVDKKTNLLNEMYSIGMDKDGDMRDRLNASKIFLSSVPVAETKLIVEHEHKHDIALEFKNKLAERQKQLYSMANNVDEILDAEIDE